jgi:tetratricopeptide (TPR) repeat protein/tRNA A-37 threonylcarbamoyl transferase component Bud32
VGRNELIEQLVTTWEELCSQGQTTSVEELCRDHPELVDSVREALTHREEQDGGLAETSDVATSRATDLEATCDVLGTTQELDKLTRLGPFHIVKLMAEGGMGAVYEAVDDQLGRSVALKVMRPQVAGHEKARARFLREARAAAALDHDHIVRIYEVGEDQGIPYLAMQLLHGQTLNQRLHQGSPLANAEVLRIGREIAEGLAVAHACGLVHRDIKPANVWLEEGSGRVKILDFGLARAANETARLTQDGSLLGTPAFMSPEQAQAGSAGELDHRSDLFSLGSVLYRMVTGRLPFPAEGTAALLLALVRDNPIPPRQLNPRIPPALDELILRLLAKDPAARPQSAQAVVETIQRLEPTNVPAAWGGLDLMVKVEDADANAGALQPRARKRFPVALAVLVVIAALAAGSALLLPRLLDAAGNMGELTLDSPASAVAVTVTRGGRTVGLLDPATRPTLRLPAGTYMLELADTTGTLVLARTQVDLRRGARQVVRLVRNIAEASARDRAAAVVAALERATDRAGKARVIAAAARLKGVLEKLAERAARDALFQAELARHFAANGKPSLAEAARTKARTLFEAKLAKEPENPAIAADLAQVLLENDEHENPIRWTVLKPVAAKSELGATLSLLPDDSILASGANPPKDRYNVVLTVDTAIDLAGVRLEALTHPSLPGNGPGRSSVGIFSQNSWTVIAAPPDRKDPITLQFDNAWTDHQYGPHPISSDGHWNIAGSQGGNCTAIWSMSNRVRLAANTKLTCEMRCQTGNDLGENLGRFRLSASSDSAALDREQTRSTAMKLTNPWEKLAAAYALNGRNNEALEYLGRALERADGYGARKPILEFAARFDDLLPALIKRQPDDPQVQLAVARKLAQRGKQRLGEEQPGKAHADLEESRALFTRLRAQDPEPRWTVLTPVEMKTETGARLELQTDGSVFVHQVPPARNDTYSLVFQPGSKGITGLRLEVLADSRLPHGGPGWGDNGNFVLNELTLQAAPAESSDTARSITLRNASADFSQTTGGNWDVRGAVDGDGTTGWAVLPEFNKDHTAVFELAEDVGDGPAARLTVQLIHRYATPDRNLGRFRFSFTNDRAALLASQIRMDLKDHEVVDCHVALGKAYAQQGQTNEAAASFAEALALAPDRAARGRLIAAAAPLQGVLERIAERATGDPRFQAELARQFDEQGQAPLAHAARTKARALYEGKLAKEPENSELAAELAQLLWDQHETEHPGRWTVLTPTKMESQGGATLTRLEDGSILAGGTNPDKDTYTFIAQTDLPRIMAFRLEAMAHPSLGKGGPGRVSWGNFALSEIALTAEPLSAAAAAAAEARAVKIINPRADFEQDRFPIAASLDGNPGTAWSIDPRVGINHTGFFEIESSPRSGFDGGTKLTFTLDFQFNIRHALGRFRLSVSGDPATLDREQTRLAARKVTDPWAKLAAAYAVSGRHDEALKYFGAALQRADGYEASKLILELTAHFEEVVSALIKRQPDDPQLQLALARELTARANQRLAENQPAKVQAELEKSRAIYTRLRARDPVPQWIVLAPVEMKTESGARLELQSDGSIFVHQPPPVHDDTYSLVFLSRLKGIRGLRLEVLADPRLPHGGPGWAENGNFVLNELTLQAAPAERPDSARLIRLRNASADFSQTTGGYWDVRGAVDGNGTTGWAVLPEFNQGHTAVFELAEDVDDGPAARLTVRLIQRFGDPTHKLGRFRVSLTNDRATLQATRIRLDLKDSEVVDCHLALGKAYAQQGRTREADASFARAQEQAPDRASRARIISAAAPLKGMLEKLTAHAAGDAQFQAELARHFDEQGHAPLADAARGRARALYERQRATEPDNAVLAGELADLLLMDRRAEWTVLKPSALKSERGATLTLQADGSILASGINAASGDIYTISAASPLDRIAAVRLEALPDPSLPSKGPGRHPSGNFQLSAFRLHRPANEDASGLTPLPLASACASFDYKASNADIAGTIDEGLKQVWHVFGRIGEAHEAVFLVQEAAAAAASRGRPLVIELRHREYNQGINLGRFRLSVSGDAAIFARQRRRFAAIKLADPWRRLAAAFRLVGDQKALDGLLKHRPLAAVGIGDLYAADQEWERAIAEYRKGITAQPTDGACLTKLATAYQSAGRTREAVPHLATLSSAHPEDTILSLKVAALQAWFGQDKELAATRQRVLAFAQDTSSVNTANRAAKVCSLLPSTDTAELEAALTLGRTAVKLGPGGEWNLLALGMAEYRSGNLAAADQALRAAVEAGPSNPFVTVTAPFYRAMSLFRQGKPDEARQLAIAATARMKPLPADERNPLAGNASHDDLVLWLAHKEAQAMIQFDAPATAPATPGGN